MYLNSLTVSIKMSSESFSLFRLKSLKGLDVSNEDAKIFTDEFKKHVADQLNINRLGVPLIIGASIRAHNLRSNLKNSNFFTLFVYYFPSLITC